MRHTRQLALGSALLLCLGALGGCGDAPEGQASEPRTVAIRSFEFLPSRMSIQPGAGVVWINRDDILHTVTSGTPGKQGVPGVSEDVAPSPDGTFDLDLDREGSTAAFTFEDAGTYPYFCAIHSGMSGTVRVA